MRQEKNQESSRKGRSPKGWLAIEELQAETHADLFAWIYQEYFFSGGTVFFAHNESASAKFQRAEQGRNQAGVSQQLQRQIKQTFHRQEFNILTNATDIMNSFLVPAATCLMRSSCGYRHSIAQMLADKQQHKGTQHLAPKETAETFDVRTGWTETGKRVYCIMRLQGPLSTLLPPN